MFNLFVSGIQAYNQIGIFIGAVICLGFAGLLLGSSLYWRVHAIRASGTIAGVLKEGTFYYPVYRYRLADGQFHEAKSNMGSGSLQGMETGRAVKLMISAHNPNEARQAGDDYLIDIIGAVFLVPGVWLGYTALIAYSITPMTWFMAFAFLVYAAERLRTVFTPKAARVSIEEWKKLHNMGDAGAVDLTKVKPMESFPQTAPSQNFQNSKATGPLLAFFAVVLLLVGAYQGVRIFRFETSGARANGEVVRLVEQSGSGSSGGYVYYPVVRFRTAQNVQIEFKDEIGSNPPTRRPGDRAAVLYLPANPRQAMIDRGIFNLLLPGLLFAGAGLVAWLMVWLRRRARTAEATRQTGVRGAVSATNA